MGMMSWTSIQRKGQPLTELSEMKNDVLGTAIDVKVSVESNPRFPTR